MASILSSTDGPSSNLDAAPFKFSNNKIIFVLMCILNTFLGENMKINPMLAVCLLLVPAITYAQDEYKYSLFQIKQNIMLINLSLVRILKTY